MSSPSISVIMPVYNSAEYVEGAIQSILNQSFSDFEFIIINDGSNDASDDVILKFKDDRIVYVKFEVNKGIVAALNFGLSIAKGKYIARMDSDDISFLSRLEIQFNYLEANSNVILCGAYMQNLLTNENILYPINNSEIRIALS